MALSEGWAYFNEWRVARMYLNFNAIENIPYDWKINPTPYSYDRSLFPLNYVRMFYDLENIGCSLNKMEKSLATNNFTQFKANLITYYPALSEKITLIITDHETNLYK